MCEKEATTFTVGVVDMYFRVFPGFSFAPLINGYPQSSGSQIRLVFSPQFGIRLCCQINLPQFHLPHATNRGSCPGSGVNILSCVINLKPCN